MTKRAAREGQHDDLVLAVALAAWFGENGSGGSTIFEPTVIRGLDVNSGVFGNADLASIEWDKPEEWEWLT